VQSVMLFVRAKNDPRLLSGALRDAVNEIDKDVPLYRLRPFSDQLRNRG